MAPKLHSFQYTMMKIESLSRATTPEKSTHFWGVHPRPLIYYPGCTPRIVGFHLGAPSIWCSHPRRVTQCPNYES